MSAANINSKTSFLAVCVFVLLILLLASFNIYKYQTPDRVLGVETNAQIEDEEFWEEFLQTNPGYIPGWVELGRPDKVKEINPNY